MADADPTNAQLLAWAHAVEDDGVNVNAGESSFIADMIVKLDKGWTLTPAQAAKIESIYTERTP